MLIKINYLWLLKSGITFVFTVSLEVEIVRALAFVSTLGGEQTQVGANIAIVTGIG